MSSNDSQFTSKLLTAGVVAGPFFIALSLLEWDRVWVNELIRLYVLSGMAARYRFALPRMRGGHSHCFMPFQRM